MTQIITTLTIIVQLLPLIRQLVVTLEELYPDSGNGAGKKAILNAALDSAVDGVEQIQTIVKSAPVQGLIDAVVALAKKKAG